MCGVIIDLHLHDPASVQPYGIVQPGIPCRNDPNRRIDTGVVLYEVEIMTATRHPFLFHPAGRLHPLSFRRADGEVLSDQVTIPTREQVSSTRRIVLWDIDFLFYRQPVFPPYL